MAICEVTVRSLTVKLPRRRLMNHRAAVRSTSARRDGSSSVRENLGPGGSGNQRPSEDGRQGREKSGGWRGLRLVTSSAIDQLELGINDPTESCRLLTVIAYS